MSTQPASEPRARLRFDVPAGQSRVRLDVYLTRMVENATRAKVQAAIDDGLVLVNGKARKSSYAVLPGDVIEVTLRRPPAPDIVPEQIPLSIVYEDDDVLVVDKPAGMVTHPAHGNYTGTLVHAVLFHAMVSGGAPGRPGIVHRLDKDTSGLLVLAKNEHAHAALAKQFADRTVEREYHAIVWGRMRSPHGTIDAALARSQRDRKKVAVASGGKRAVTEYDVLETFRFLSLVRLHLLTGRTHQIRVHLAHVGHPVFGDLTYGGRSPGWAGTQEKRLQQATNLLKIIDRQALHARTIGFRHPVTEEMMRFSSPIPHDMEEILQKVREAVG
ncbi:MAG: RluA family pseudouridine synthase [Bacteroidetes bacterium]|jgi:23S rRNA pseudouridine1911/1915/1917 synthase|nr:RluA family pseudouridine synthase [Bacteroidota bacterium]